MPPSPLLADSACPPPPPNGTIEGQPHLSFHLGCLPSPSGFRWDGQETCCPKTDSHDVILQCEPGKPCSTCNQRRPNGTPSANMDGTNSGAQQHSVGHVVAASALRAVHSKSVPFECLSVVCKSFVHVQARA